mmetsp:Transcript_814/g.2207  ORF Transcript_814/g.2207 Transcript_814/m.2207 type:complete len:223 (+) Transcript_814:1089-1757(+)
MTSCSRPFSFATAIRRIMVSAELGTSSTGIFFFMTMSSMAVLHSRTPPVARRRGDTEPPTVPSLFAWSRLLAAGIMSLLRSLLMPLSTEDFVPARTRKRGILEYLATSRRYAFSLRPALVVRTACASSTSATSLRRVSDVISDLTTSIISASMPSMKILRASSPGLGAVSCRRFTFLRARADPSRRSSSSSSSSLVPSPSASKEASSTSGDTFLGSPPKSLR